MSEESHQHETHGHGSTASAGKMAVVTLINLLGFVMEVLGGLMFGSVALLSDAVHMLFDSVSYATAFTAAYIAENVEGSEEWTYGFHRAEVVSAIINGILLIPLAGFIIWESYQRLVAPQTIDILPTLGIALLGLAVNALSVIYLRGKEMGLNEKGAFYHLLGDSAGSVAVIVGLVTVYFTEILAIDAVVAGLIALFVIWSASKVLIEGAGIIMQKSPISPEDIKRVVEDFDGVEEAHDIKSWQVCSKVNVCTVHAEMSISTLDEAEKVREKVDQELKDRFNLQHVTLQMEKEPTRNHLGH